MKTGKSLFFFLLACLPTFVFSQYGIIPKPTIEILSAGEFQFSLNHQIECNVRDSSFQSQIQYWLKGNALKKATPNKIIQTKITLLFVGEKKWKSFLGKQLMRAEFKPGKEGYAIKIDQHAILVLAQTETGLFYGFQTLKQLFNLSAIPCGQIYDTPSFAVRAWQDDISRGPIPTMEMLKKEIRVMAGYKLNYFTLYTEHVFKYDSHPDIAPKDGISKQEIQELTNYAKHFHVALIANQQSFGHMEKVLEIPAYRGLAENKHILSPADDKTYFLLRDFYQEQNSCYKGDYFHVNADETFGLGSGASKKMVEAEGVGAVYGKHITKIHELLEGTGKRMLVWADIIGNHPEIGQKIPADIILIPWAYQPAKDFTSLLKPIKESNLEFWVAPGIGNWQNLFPNGEEAFVNIYYLIKDGKKFGATGVLNTTWDDDGFAFFEHNWRGLIWGADISWNITEQDSFEYRKNRFLTAYDDQFYGCKGMTAIQVQLIQIHQSKTKTLLKNRQFFEGVFPIYPEHANEAVEKNNRQMVESLNLYLKEMDSLSAFAFEKASMPYVSFAIKCAIFAANKNLLRYHYSLLQNGLISKESLFLEWKQLLNQLQNIKNDYAYLYLGENRPYWLKQNEEKLNLLYTTLEKLPMHCVIEPSTTLVGNNRLITLSAPLTQLPIYYSLDGTPPNWFSKKYQKPIAIKKDILIQCAVIENNQVLEISSDSFYFHQAIGKIAKINIPYSKYDVAYSGGGFMGLADGKIDYTTNLRSGKWQGYSGGDLVVDLDFEKPTSIHSFKMGFYQNTTSWVMLPKEIEIQGSNDGKKFVSFSKIQHNIPLDTKGAIRYDFIANFDKEKYQYLKIVCKYAGPLPAWHASAGSASMLFADEIIVK